MEFQVRELGSVPLYSIILAELRSWTNVIGVVSATSLVDVVLCLEMIGNVR